MGPNDIRADGLDKRVVGMRFRSHAPLYQRGVYISSAQSFIARHSTPMQKDGVEKDASFGDRLRSAIAASPFKNARQFAIKGMEWPETAGPQRLNGYLKGRVPDVETLVAMADKLGVSLAALLGLSEDGPSIDEPSIGILRHLLQLEGIPEDKADMIANASFAAHRLMRGFPDDEPLLVRMKYAARAAWLQQHHPAPGR